MPRRRAAGTAQTSRRSLPRHPPSSRIRDEPSRSTGVRRTSSVCWCGVAASRRSERVLQHAVPWEVCLRQSRSASEGGRRPGIWTPSWPRLAPSWTAPWDPAHEPARRERSSVSAGLPRVGCAAARHVAAVPLRHRRSRAGRVRLGRPPPRGRAALLAGAAAGTDGVRRLAVSVAVVVRRQRAAHQPGRADRRRASAGGRLRGPGVLPDRGRIREGRPVQVPHARDGLEPLQRRRPSGSAGSV